MFNPAEKIPLTDRQWLQTLKAPVFVIGNGPLSKKLDLPNEGSVIRFNNFVESEWAGWRTTHWVASGYSDIEIKHFPYCFIPRDPRATAKQPKILMDFEKRFGRPVIYTFGNEHIYRHFPQAGLTWKFWPSTGFSLLAWLWSKGIKPKVAGFNGLVAGHHSNPFHVHDHQRTGRKEWEIIHSRCEIL